MRETTAAGALALALVASASAAQSERFDFRAGGGAIVPSGAASDQFETGWQLTAAAAWRFGESLALELDYDYSRERLIAHAIPVAFVNGEHQVHSFELDLRWTVTPHGPAPISLLAGPGLYRRETAITRVRDYLPGPPICDPWLEVCDPGPVPAEQLLGSRTSTDPGFNAAVAVDVPLKGRVGLFFEVRWRYIWGNAYGLPGSTSRRGNAFYFPLTLGVRF